MDMDLDFSDDKIESFLTTKLEEIRLKNESLEAVLDGHKQALKVSSDESLINEVCFTVIESESWKRLCNNQYVIGYAIYTSVKAYKDITVFLTWDSEETFSYKTQFFSEIPASREDCKEIQNCNLITDTFRKGCDIFKGKTYLVITFDVPQYLYKLEPVIYGLFTCNIEGKVVSTSLPKVNISAKDSTISSLWLSQDSLQNIFSIITCSNQINLVMILPEEWTASLISTFEIHCALTHIKMSILCKLYFVANDLSKLFNNALLVVHRHHENYNTLFLTVYATNNDQMYALCHHLGTCLPNIVFFPLRYYSSFLCKNALFSKELLQEFGKNLCHELEFGYKFAQGNNNENINEFRSNLNKIESKTDKLFLQISNMKY